MTYDAIKIWVDVAQFVITGGIGVYIYLINKNDATNSRISSFEASTDDRLDDHHTRLATVEAQIKQMPTHGDLGEVRESVASLQAETKNQTEILRGIQKQVSRLTDFLLDNPIKR